VNRLINNMVKIAVILGLVGGGAWYFFGATEREKRRVQSAAYDAKAAVKKVGELGGALDPGNMEAARKCRENLKWIESCKRAAAQKAGITTGMVPLNRILDEMGVKKLPRCPAGGEYIIGELGYMAKCSIGAASPGTKADDHLFSQF